MSRPKQLKHVDFSAFSVPHQDRVSLGAEESYALFLKDIEGRHQQDCANLMGISRASFQQILDQAHAKMAQALLSGARLQIQGGEFVTASCTIKCSACGHIYLPQLIKDKKNCPNCNSTLVGCNNKGNHCVILGCPNAE